MVAARPSTDGAKPNWAVVELRVDRLTDLFDPFDPFPTPSRDLSRSAEDFIVGWAREAHERAPLSIVAYVPANEARAGDADALAQAVKGHFTARARRVSGDLHELFRVGRVSLVIGLGVLALCIASGSLIEAGMGERPLARFLSEGLIILGWVANWRPLEIFLYAWWPLLARRTLFRRLADAAVTVRAA